MFMIHHLWKCVRIEDGSIWLIRRVYSSNDRTSNYLSLLRYPSGNKQPPLIVSLTNPIDDADTHEPTTAEVLMVDVVIIAAVTAILSTVLLMLAAVIIDCCETNDVSLP